MAIHQDIGLTLRRLDYSETSQVLVVMTQRYGKVRLIAKGARRSTKTRFSPGIDLLELGDLSFSVRSPAQEALATLTAWKQRTAFTSLRERLPRLHAAQYAAEITAGLTEDWDPHPDLFDGLVTMMERLSTASEVSGAVVEFQRKLLTSIGSMPRFAACVVCGRPISPRGPVYFSSFEGGLLCRDCEPARTEKRQVNPASLAALRGESSAAGVGAFDILNYHLGHLMGRAPLLADVLVDPRLARGVHTRKS